MTLWVILNLFARKLCILKYSSVTTAKLSDANLKCSVVTAAKLSDTHSK